MTVDVILSGEAKPSANRQPAWIVKEGLFTDDVIGNFVDPEMGTGRGRVRLQNEEGGSAGVVLGPLPSYNFCVDVNFIEVSTRLKNASLVDFAPNFLPNSNSSTRTPSTLTGIGPWGRDILADNRGCRFGADACTGESTEHVNNSVACYTDNEGELHCPESAKFDLGNTTTDQEKNKCYPNCKDSKPGGKSDALNPNIGVDNESGKVGVEDRASCRRR